MNVEREQWVSALSAVPKTALVAAVRDIPDAWTVRPKALPQAGLGMLKLRDGALNEPFYLGEFPLATCWVTITTTQGDQAEGAALVMDDDLEHAQRLALCDAILATRLPGWQRIAELVEQGEATRAHQARERKAMLARTRVDFTLLDEAGQTDA